MRTILGILLATSFSILIMGCVNNEPKAKNSLQERTNIGFIFLSKSQLEKLGVFIKDTAIMYNNSINGTGSLDIVIRDKSYLGNASTIEQTTLPFYPRYITTLDTIQRTMYMLSGHQLSSDVEARKWQSFESLVPVIVEQKQGERSFGETLIFWMTKTPELEKLLHSITNE